MDKKQLRQLMPHDKHDEERAKYLATLGYDTVKPVAGEMLRWLRTYRVVGDRAFGEAPVADIFIEFFIRNAVTAAEDVEKALRSSRQDHLKYVIVTRVLPEWPRSAVERVKDDLQLLVTDSGMPETALMALEILAKHDLTDKDWLSSWLNFIAERMERNFREAHLIQATYFSGQASAP